MSTKSEYIWEDPSDLYYEDAGYQFEVKFETESHLPEPEDLTAKEIEYVPVTRTQQNFGADPFDVIAQLEEELKCPLALH